MRVRGKLCFSLLLLSLAAATGDAQDEPAAASNSAELVARAVQNEVATKNSSTAHFMFRNHRQTAHLNQTKLIVETREATAGMLVEVDGHPLSSEQRQAEEARLQSYVHNPEELNR